MLKKKPGAVPGAKHAYEGRTGHRLTRSVSMLTRYTRLVLFGVAVATLIVAGGCDKPVDGIGLGRTSLDFELSRIPQQIEVWNSNPNLEKLTINIEASKAWINLDTNAIESDGPDSAAGPFDKQFLRISIDRSQLTVGRHTGEIRFSARGVVTRTIAVAVTQDTPPTENKLQIIGMAPTYSEPYLLDFTFGLRYGDDGDQVVAEPAQFSVSALEDGQPLSSAAPVFFRRGQSRQLKLMLVLDYTLSIQQTSGAIAAMETAAKNVLLPALNETAQVGVVEFHTQFSQVPPRVVVPLTVDRQLVREGIGSIQDSVGNLAGGSRVWDACDLAAAELEPGDPTSEERVILLFSNGADTSSLNTVTDVIDAARNANAKVYAVGVGSNQDELALQLLTDATEGELFPVSSTALLSQAFEEVVDNLNAQYILRWATLRRGSSGNHQTFKPSFTLTLSGTGDTVTYNDAARFDPWGTGETSSRGGCVSSLPTARMAPMSSCGPTTCRRGYRKCSCLWRVTWVLLSMKWNLRRMVSSRTRG